MMNETTPNNLPHQKMSPQRKMWLTRVGIVFLIIGVIWLIYWLAWGRFALYTDDAYVGGNLAQLMPQVSGTIVSVNTDDTRYVVEGQKLIQLDGTDRLITLRQARAHLALTVRQVQQYYEDVLQAQALVAARKADLENAQFNLSRRLDLVSQQAISQEELQEYETTLSTDRARYDYAKHKLASALALVENTNLYNHPLVRQAEEKYKRAYLDWVRTTIYSPVTGYVAKRNAQVGQQVNLGSALLSVVSLNDVWVDANYKEDQLDRIRIGQSVALTADANGFTYHGKVVGLSPGTGSAFALLPPQNATGNWIKIVQRLPIRIVMDPKEIEKYPLQLGLSMRVTIYTRGLKGPRLSHVVSQRPLYYTTIYINQLAKVNRDIAAILKANAPNRLLINKMGRMNG